MFRLCNRIGLCRVRVQLHILEKLVYCHMNRKVEQKSGRSVVNCVKSFRMIAVYMILILHKIERRQKVIVFTHHNYCQFVVSAMQKENFL